ncbi:MAG: ferritin family protein [Deltaproteobacteria bacterium]|nr:ferritin family protein [Deltaproteobacteria bacterium]
MVYDFNVDEIFEIAEQIERNGTRFYRQNAENVSSSPIQQLFLDLAAMEEEHEKLFISMRADLSDREKEPTVFDPEGESVLYLRALADLRVFDEKAGDSFVIPEGISKEEKARKILRAAIGLEKEAIVFYLGMKEFVPEKLGKDKIENIIKEEMKHIRFLNDSLHSLKK